MSVMTDSTRAPRSSAIDQLADRYLADVMRLDPLQATAIGSDEHQDELPDLSPEGHAARTDLARATLAAVGAGHGDTDATDDVTVAALRERLGLRLELDADGAYLRELNVIESPVQNLRAVFDLMPTATVEDWSTVARRLAAVPAAVAGYQESLRRAAGAGDVVARRQVEGAAGQCVEFAAADGFFRSFAGGALAEGDQLPAPLSADLRRGSESAAAAYDELATFLRTELLPQAPEADAVGRERYALESRYFLGAVVDLEESYEWGLAEMARIEGEMRAVARQISPDADIDTAVALLDADPGRTIHGKEAFRDWMQAASDQAVAELGGRHFDIPDAIRRLDCRIAPTTSGVIYYTPPTDDLSRPGTMWWAVPEGIESFSTWREVTTVYHEGVPGHHLQCAQTAYRVDELNRWRRLGCWVSGHGEGWALYAERLMAELGYLDDPGARMGMLDSQAFRAARVVVDIGVHLGLTAPAEVGGGTWDAGKAWSYLRAHCRIGDATLRFELDRYLGWPGQAPSYKIGERIWLELREEVRRREGAAFDLAAFHRRALDLGSVGLDVLRTSLLG